MKKKWLFYIFLVLLLSINFDVYAESHDVQAKYEEKYSEEVFVGNLDNNKIEIDLDKYILELSSSLEDVKVVVIKAKDEANSYAKSFTNTDENYYISFYKDKNKLNSTSVNIKIKNEQKVLNIYDHNGKLQEKSNEEITLTGNDYFMIVTEKIEISDSGYKITDINSLVNDLKDIELKDNSSVEIYNFKNEEIDKNSVLGTGYKIIINNDKIINEYTIIVMGDITGDARINLNDVTRLYHYYKSIEKMDEPFVLAGDVASNEIINLNDITKIYHYYKKIIPNL